MENDRCFTLIELLSVIVICSILASLVLPAFSQVQGKAQHISCTSNLRQLQYAFIQYATDNSNMMPPYIRNSTYGHGGINWARYTWEYYSDVKLLKCPSSPKAAPTDSSTEALHLYDGNYGWNFDGTQANRGPINTAIPNPSGAYLLFDSGDQCVIYGANNWSNLMEELDLDWDSRAEGANRHAGEVNIVFLDGHVSPRKLLEFISAPNNSYTAPWHIEWEQGKLTLGLIPFPYR